MYMPTEVCIMIVHTTLYSQNSGAQPCMYTYMAESCMYVGVLVELEGGDGICLIKDQHGS